MNEIEEIERLERELHAKKDRLRNTQQNCTHKWSETKYDPEKYREAHFSHYIPHGSDPEPVYTYSDAYKDRWCRTCQLCEKVEYSYEKKAVKYEPYFGDKR